MYHIIKKKKKIVTAKEANNNMVYSKEWPQQIRNDKISVNVSRCFIVIVYVSAFSIKKKNEKKISRRSAIIGHNTWTHCVKNGMRETHDKPTKHTVENEYATNLPQRAQRHHM